MALCGFVSVTPVPIIDASFVVHWLLFRKYSTDRGRAPVLERASPEVCEWSNPTPAVF